MGRRIATECTFRSDPVNTSCLLRFSTCRSLRSEKVAYLQNHKELGVETEGGTVPYIAALDDVIRLLISEGVVVFL